MSDCLTAIVVAVEEEFKAIRKRMPRAEVESAGGISFVRGQLGGIAVVLTKTGMGSDRAYSVTRRLLEQTNPSAVIIAGFCAGLKSGVCAGDVVVATALATPGGIRGSGNLRPTIGFSASHGLLRPPLPDAQLLSLARQSLQSESVHFGPLMSSPSILRTATEKSRVSFGSSVLAADMESRGAAAAAGSAGVPWLVVRAVTDGIDDDLPLDFSRFVDAAGEADRARIMLHVLFRPWLIPALIRLGARSSIAATNLAKYVQEIVILTSDRGKARISTADVES